MPSVLTPEAIGGIIIRLADANRQFNAAHPGDKPDRQPVHTVYGGAHLFTADIAHKLGAAALKHLEEFAPDPDTFATALGIGAETLDGEPTPPPERMRGVHPRLSTPGSTTKPAAPRKRQSVSPAGPATIGTLAEAVYTR